MNIGGLYQHLGDALRYSRRNFVLPSSLLVMRLLGGWLHLVRRRRNDRRWHLRLRPGGCFGVMIYIVRHIRPAVNPAFPAGWQRLRHFARLCGEGVSDEIFHKYQTKVSLEFYFG